MDQQLANLQQLASTLRQSTHTLERYPDQLYNQIMGRVGETTYLLEMKPPAAPYLRLTSTSLKRADQTIIRSLVGHRDRVTGCAFSPNGKFLVSASDDKTLRLWDIQTGAFLREFRGHIQPVTACAFHPDGRRILSASEDTTLRLWDRDTGRTIRVFEGHEQTVNACAFSPDGRLILSASGGNEMQQTRSNTDNSLRLWDCETGECLHIFVFPDKLHNRICSCAFSADGRFALSGDGDGKLRLWDVETRQCLQTLEENIEYVLACVFLPDDCQALQPSIPGNHLALSASADRSLRLWEIGVHAPEPDTNISIFRELFANPLEHSLKVLTGHQDYVTGCAIIFDTRYPERLYALSSSQDQTLRLWDLISGESLRVLEGHTDWVNGCAVSRDMKLAASASSDHTVILWDIRAMLPSDREEDIPSNSRESWQSIRIFAGHAQSVEGCAFSPDGGYIVSASTSFALHIWDSTDGESVRSFSYGKWVRCCAYSPDGKYILGGYTDGALVLWNVETGQQVRVFTSHGYDVWHCAFSPDGRYILSASLDHTLRYWDVESGRCLHTLEGHHDGVNACAISPDGKLGLSGSRDWTLRLWNLETGECLRVMEKGRSGQFRGMLDVNDCTFSPDGRYALSASDDQTVTLWSIESGQLVRTYTGHAKAVKGCAFSPDGRFIASTSSDQSVRLWEVKTATCLAIFRGHTDTVYSCAFHPAGSAILSESRDQTLRLWDISAYQISPHVGEDQSLLEGHRLPVLSCRFSSDGKYVLSASKDMTLRLWDVATRQVLRIFTGHTAAINDCAFSTDGRFILSASNDGTLRLWDVHSESGESLKVFTGHTEAVWGCAFSPDGRHILSGGDRRILLWDSATEHSTSLCRNRRQDWTRCSFTEDGRYVLSTSMKYTLKLWDVPRERFIPSYKGIIGPSLDEEIQRMATILPTASKRSTVNTAVSADGRLAASAFQRGVCIVWEIATGREIHHYTDPTGFYISDVLFSLNGRYILMNLGHIFLRILDVMTGKAIAYWPAETEIHCAVFDADGRQVIVGDASGAVHFFLLDGPSAVAKDGAVNKPVLDNEVGDSPASSGTPINSEQRIIVNPVSIVEESSSLDALPVKKKGIFSFAFRLRRRRNTSK